MEEDIENKICSTTWVEPKVCFESYPYRKNRALKIQNDPKIKSNLKVRIEGIIENESCSTILVDQK